MSGAIARDFEGVVRATLSALGIGGADQSRETVLEHVIQNAGFEIRPLVARLEQFGARHAEHEIDFSEIYSVAFALHSFLDRIQLAERITGGEFGDLGQQVES